jgi:Tol biopolymer transport system component
LEGVRVIGFPAISLNADKVTFTRDGGELAVYDVAERELKSLQISGRNAVFAPDGKRIAFDNGHSIYVHDIERNITTELSSGTEPSWHGDGKSVAIRVNDTKIDLVDVDTRKRSPLIEAESRVSIPRWSFGGEWFMYTRRGARSFWSRGGWEGSEPSQIVIRDVRTNIDTPIGQFYKANPGDYTWVRNQIICDMPVR